MLRSTRLAVAAAGSARPAAARRPRRARAPPSHSPLPASAAGSTTRAPVSLLHKPSTVTRSPASAPKAQRSARARRGAPAKIAAGTPGKSTFTAARAGGSGEGEADAPRDSAAVRVAVGVAGGRKEAEGGAVGGGEAVREGSPLRDAAAGDAEGAPLPLPVPLGDALPGGSEGVGAPGEVLGVPLREAPAERVARGEADSELQGEPLLLGAPPSAPASLRVARGDAFAEVDAAPLRVAHGDAVAEDDFDSAVAKDDGDDDAEAEAEAVAGADAEWLPETLPLPVLLPLRVRPPLPLRRAVGDAQAVARAEPEAEALDRGDSLPLTLPLGELLRLGNTVGDADAEALRVGPREAEAQRVAPDEGVIVGEPLPLQEPAHPPPRVVGVPVLLDERVGHAAEGEAQPLLLVEALRVESVLGDVVGVTEIVPQ